jgi:nucleoside-diphosphate-sugar epimerase
MKILITGGTGYIGSHIAADLIKHGHQVDVVARGPQHGATASERVRQLEAVGVNVLYADLSRPGDLTAHVDAAPYEVIVHGVCSFLEPTRSESLTIRAGQEIVAFARGCQHLNQIIDLGNCLVLADAGPTAVPTEEFLCRPNTAHGRNKLLVEQMFQQSGLPWVILRIGQVYGSAGSSFDWVVLDGIRRGQLPLLGSGRNRVGLVHVDDVAQATRLVIEQAHQNLILNVSSADIRVTQGEVFDLVADSFGVPRPRRIPIGMALTYAWFVEKIADLQHKEPAFVPDMIRVLSGSWLLDIEKARKLLGYQPAHPNTLEGIRTAYADVFAGKARPFVPAGRLTEARGLTQTDR